MIRAILRFFSYRKVEWGFSCGRHYVFVDGVGLAQHGPVYVLDQEVERLQRLLEPHPKGA